MKTRRPARLPSPRLPLPGARRAIQAYASAPSAPAGGTMEFRVSVPSGAACSVAVRRIGTPVPTPAVRFVGEDQDGAALTWVRVTAAKGGPGGRLDARFGDWPEGAGGGWRSTREGFGHGEASGGDVEGEAVGDDERKPTRDDFDSSDGEASGGGRWPGRDGSGGGAGGSGSGGGGSASEAAGGGFSSAGEDFGGGGAGEAARGSRSLDRDGTNGDKGWTTGGGGAGRATGGTHWSDRDAVGGIGSGSISSGGIGSGGIGSGGPAGDLGVPLTWCDWEPSLLLDIPESWPPGLYVARFTVEAPLLSVMALRGRSAYVPFVVRGPLAAGFPTLVVLPFAAYIAANPWPIADVRRARALSLDRPFAGNGLPAGFAADAAFVEPLTATDFATSLDLHAGLVDPAAYRKVLFRADLWSPRMRAAIADASLHGTDVGGLDGVPPASIDFAPGPDGRDDRILIRY
ncbi:hypothetical protein ABH926_010222 [Catenulispora sp. GP43]|uniref:N,N-dimethylformamidase beta subunit family domain-containing protein n=1 Tax=Catenulispora sp. GP43 TaxID=3156263 RepID=UPI00351499E8